MEILDEILINELVDAISSFCFVSGMLTAVLFDGLLTLAFNYFKDKKSKKENK